MATRRTSLTQITLSYQSPNALLYGRKSLAASVVVDPNRIDAIGMTCSCLGHLALLGGLIWASGSAPAGETSSTKAIDVTIVSQSAPSTGTVSPQAAAATDPVVLGDPAAKAHAAAAVASDRVAMPPGALPGAARAQMSASPAAAFSTAAAVPSGADHSDYQRRLNELIARHSRYPPEARQRRLAGVAHLAFRIDRSGAVLDSWIEESSGSEILDSAALAALERAKPMPAIPLNLSAPLDFVVEIDSAASSMVRARARAGN